jgi:hypothetical protein
MITGALLLWRLLPHDYAAAAWCALALVLREIGEREMPWQMKYAAPALIVFSCPWAFVTGAGTPVCIACAAACLATASRTTDEILRDAMIAVCTVTLGFTAWRALPPEFVTLAWLGETVIIIVAARSLNLTNAALLAHVVTAAAVLRSVLHDRTESLPASIAAIGILYGVSIWNRRYSLPASALTSLLLWTHVSGGMLTIALGSQGLLLMAAGFVARERLLRLQGLSLLLACILKLFLYDLRNLETLHRIGSFITLGLILLGVSWIYARFRERYF